MLKPCSQHNGIWREACDQSGALMRKISASSKRHLERFLTPSCPLRTQGKDGSLWPRSGFSPDTESAWVLILGVSAPGIWKLNPWFVETLSPWDYSNSRGLRLLTARGKTKLWPCALSIQKSWTSCNRMGVFIEIAYCWCSLLLLPIRAVKPWFPGLHNLLPFLLSCVCCLSHWASWSVVFSEKEWLQSEDDLWCSDCWSNTGKFFMSMETTF